MTRNSIETDLIDVALRMAQKLEQQGNASCSLERELVERAKAYLNAQGKEAIYDMIVAHLHDAMCEAREIAEATRSDRWAVISDKIANVLDRVKELIESEFQADEREIWIIVLDEHNMAVSEMCDYYPESRRDEADDLADRLLGEGYVVITEEISSKDRVSLLRRYGIVGYLP